MRIFIYFFMAVCVFIVAALSYPIFVAINNKPVIAFISQSQKYRIEDVNADMLLFPTRLGYLRVTELANPDNVYRSPLAIEDSLEMDPIENNSEVGVRGMAFEKNTHRFIVRINGWREMWPNFFISNTLYNVENDL